MFIIGPPGPHGPPGVRGLDGRKGDRVSWNGKNEWKKNGMNCDLQTNWYFFKCSYKTLMKKEKRPK